MTGGLVGVLGAVGRNFAAGMSGGIAYVYDPERQLEALCNRASVELDPVGDAEALKALVQRHRDLTGSARAAALLADWAPSPGRFVMVMPTEYPRARGAWGGAACPTPPASRGPSPRP